MTFDLPQWLKQQSGGAVLPIRSCDLTTLTPADKREWLVTNGLGTYASGALNGANTRRYHGLLVASLTPPVRRTLVFSHLDETLTTGSKKQALATNYWRSGIVSPEGYKSLESFANEPCATWSFRVDDGRLIKQVAMLPGKQSVYVGYTWIADNGKTPAQLDAAAIFNYRDFHNQTQGAADWHFAQTVESETSVKIQPFDTAKAFYLQTDRGAYTPVQVHPGQTSWYEGYYWPREHERGLAESEDGYHGGDLTVKLESGESITICVGLEKLGSVPVFADIVSQVAAARGKLLEKAGATTAPAAVQKLVLAADQFVAFRESTDGSTIIAGYHWFSDWGRDSMIALPGLCLSTGRIEQARSILATFGKYLSQGMLPNFFPDGGQEPEYNTSDATLWWAQALLRYYKASGDKAFVALQLPLLQTVVDWHVKGTRHGLKLDQDGLVTGGDPDVQLTWMDAKCGNYVVTPRSGKAVEISALWYNFLSVMDELAVAIGKQPDKQAQLAATKNGFAAFWDDKRGYLADVLRQDGTLDESLRPNQLLAASLSYPLLTVEQTKQMLAVVEEKLLTPAGLRTLNAEHPDYKGLYGNGLESADQYNRDVTYHQGTVWPWLLGPWVEARIYAYGTGSENLSVIGSRLKHILDHVDAEGCLGSISEIFDGDAPHKAQGCIAQAWSVAEVLRVLQAYPNLAG